MNLLISVDLPMIKSKVICLCVLPKELLYDDTKSVCNGHDDDDESGDDDDTIEVFGNIALMFLVPLINM